MTYTATQTLEPLDWYPKPFTAGDMDGTVSERLLGTTSLTPHEILIREMAQNSWDAALPSGTPSFGVHLRRVDWRLRADLTRLLSQASGHGQRVHATVNGLHVLEIFDRGTSGLDGPVDLRPRLGDGPRNYEDLILKVGVQRDDPSAGGAGTYGFGKTAAYAYSRPGIVVYWTRCRDDAGQLEHRLIISAFQQSYSEGNRQYTGRHWWGRQLGEMIQPITGDEAEGIARRLFTRGFEASETGTSMLIIDPKIPDESPVPDVPPLDRDAGSVEALESLFVEAARQAIRRHLWPKLIVNPATGSQPMDLTLTVAGRPVSLHEEPVGGLALWGAAINAIRSHRADDANPIRTPQGVPVQVQEITRRGAVLGHLAFVQRIPSAEPPLAHDDLDPARVDAGIGRIALMRGKPELVVSTENWVDVSPTEGFEWLAVFKSADDQDEHYSHAEPPAHDMWVEGSSESGLIARHTRLSVTRWLRDQLAPEPAAIETERGRIAVGELSRRLGQLLPAPGALERDRTARGAPDGRTKRTLGSVDVLDARLVATRPDGWQHHRVTYIANTSAPSAQVRFSAWAVGDGGLREDLRPDTLFLRWEGAVAAPDAGTAEVPCGVPMTVEFMVPPRRAARVDMRVEAT